MACLFKTWYVHVAGSKRETKRILVVLKETKTPSIHQLWVLKGPPPKRKTIKQKTTTVFWVQQKGTKTTMNPAPKGNLPFFGL